MRIQYFREPRIFSLRLSFDAIKKIAKSNLPYKIVAVGLAYEAETNDELDNEWYIVSDNPHALYSRRFVEQNYEKED